MPLTAIERIVPSLEDVFVSLIEAHDRSREPAAGGGAMKLRRVWAVARKEFLHVLRDPRSLGMAIAIPMLLLVLFGYALTLDVDNVPLVVWDQSDPAVSREYVSRFTARATSRFRASPDNYRDVERAYRPGKALSPWSFRATSPAPPLRPPGAGAGHRRRQRLEHGDHRPGLRRGGSTDLFAGNIDAPRQPGGGGRPVDVRARVWFNADMESRNYIIPGPDRGDHDGHRGHADFAYRGAGVGNGHDGATDLHAR